ncbi:MAG: serine hydrolase [Cyanobacteria bacterium P01_A01_bin.17]
MKLWNGKALFIKVDESRAPAAFQSFSYQAIYKDTNRNKKQDAQDQGFFHPASTVKVAIASLVLEQLKQRNLDRTAKYRIVGASAWSSIETDLIEMLVASNNDAANRLILMRGFQYISDTMHARGLQQYAATRLMLNQETLTDSPPIEIRWQDTVLRIPKRTVSDTFDCYEIVAKTQITRWLSATSQLILNTLDEAEPHIKGSKAVVENVCSTTAQKSLNLVLLSHCQLVHPQLSQP